MSTTTTIARKLAFSALSVPVAAAITLGTGAAAHASEAPAPVLAPSAVLTVDPEAFTPPHPVGPMGPGDITLPPTCDLPHGCDPVDPGDDPADPVDPELNPDLPEGPDDFTNDTGCDPEDHCGEDDPGDGDGDGDPEVGDQGEPTDEPTDEPEVDDSTGTFDKPTRIDAGGLTTVATTGEDTGGSQLAWLLPGGLLVGAAGAAGAARRIRSAGQRV